MCGLFPPVTILFWLINADLRKCNLIPDAALLMETALYLANCMFLFICYGKILAISWSHHRRIQPQPTNANPASELSAQTTTFTTVTQSNKASDGNNAVDPNDKPQTSAVASSDRAMTTNGAAAAELTHEQQRQKIKSRRREFKAAYLTAAIIGTYIILWFPLMLSRVLQAVDYNPVVTNYIRRVGGPLGTCNFAFSWVIYATVSKSYRRAYRQMLIRIGCCCCKNVTVPSVDN